jgi:hypothetical protein
VTVTVLARGLRPRTPSPAGSLALARPAGDGAAHGRAGT